VLTSGCFYLSLAQLYHSAGGAVVGLGVGVTVGAGVVLGTGVGVGVGTVVPPGVGVGVGTVVPPGVGVGVGVVGVASGNGVGVTVGEGEGTVGEGEGTVGEGTEGEGAVGVGSGASCATARCRATVPSPAVISNAPSDSKPFSEKNFLFMNTPPKGW
jgi:hypothetical protein